MPSILLGAIACLWMAGRTRTPSGRSLLDQWVDRVPAMSPSRMLAIAATVVLIVAAAGAGGAELPLLLTLDVTSLLDAVFAVWLVASSRQIGASGLRVRQGIRVVTERVKRRAGQRRATRQADRSPPVEAMPPANDDDDPAAWRDAA